ncbi:MAG: DUF4136 domain-containing protein [Alphaproteobacteria bacterium]|nr:MAG: DUF4136 domain-containing protein [Alphaproteobacteria bacterium]
MASLLKRIALVGAVFLVSACTHTFRSDVTTFMSQTVPSAGKVSIVPMDQAKLDSIEYRQYASVIANELSNIGYAQAGDDNPELIVGFDIEINDGREKLETRPGMGMGAGYNYWTHSWRWGRFWGPAYPYDPFFPDNDLVARTVYFVTLKVEMRKPNGDMIYEGRAESEVRTRALPEIVPLMAEALFKEFPGQNGKTQRIVLRLDDRKAP